MVRKIKPTVLASRSFCFYILHMQPIVSFPRRFIASLLLFAALPAGAEIRVVDDLQRTVSLPAPARRVVSLAPSITETLFALGAGDQVVGVTDYCNFPPEAQQKHRVGGIVNPSIETIVRLKPDLILLSVEGNVRTDFEKLTMLGASVFVTNPRTLEGIYSSILRVGQLVGKEDSAARLVRTLRKRADSIRKNAKHEARPSVLLFVSLQPVIVAGPGTFLAELIAYAGGENAAARAPSHYSAYSREAVLKDDPDVLIFLSDIGGSNDELVRLYPEWSNLKAFRRGAVYRVNADIVSRPGPRAVDALDTLFTILHAHDTPRH
jgi:iron complex transport system substrate-binding protein